MPELYWNRMSPREKNLFYLFFIIGAVMISLLSLLPEKFHWQDVIPSWFGVSLGVFTFWMLVVGIFSFAFTLFLIARERSMKHDEEQKKDMR